MDAGALSALQQREKRLTGMGQGE
ncbi:hypothetical protein CLS_20450 [[Clostridium] cf. saccharolyticum K10]|nr:hypothetical protein CLS_20450 [[Clostridium] cf. saccharolyticum K10]